MNRLSIIEDRIRQVLSSQKESSFTPAMNSISLAFLDLALEFPGLGDFNRMAVLIPKLVLDWDTSLYLAEGDTKGVLAASTVSELMDKRRGGKRISIGLSEEPHREGDDYIVPLRNNENLSYTRDHTDKGRVVGMFSVCPDRTMDDTELVFIHKYADMLAMSLFHRLLARKNRQHLGFINKLVTDIGHNVVVPNIFFKVYLRRLMGKIKRINEIQDRLEALTHAQPQVLQSGLRDLNAEMVNAGEGLREEYDHIQKHYINTSLFLETLLRRSHFEKGHYVLQKKKCNFRRDIIEPQVDRYMHRLKENGIEVDLSAGGVLDELVEAVVDVGLISQVYANLLTNAVKYTKPVQRNGVERKFIAYGLEL
ncbi:MAG: hypothetical protein SV487_01735, partial [Thermodesulfobacteriota bacterium]|nr:hypothetical protein [Thermodesulfobacteriota bacterium]